MNPRRIHGLDKNARVRWRWLVRTIYVPPDQSILDENLFGALTHFALFAR